MSPNPAIERLFDTASLTSDSLIASALEQNERQRRLGEAMLVEMQRFQHENIELAKRVVENPGDVAGVYRQAVETMSKRQGRALELGREWFSTLAESAAAARETATKIISMQRVATEAATESASRAVNAAADTVREATPAAAAAAGSFAAAAERVADGTVREVQSTAARFAETTARASALESAAEQEPVLEPAPPAPASNGGTKRRRSARSRSANGRRAASSRTRSKGSGSTRARHPRNATARRKRAPASGDTAPAATAAVEV